MSHEWLRRSLDESCRSLVTRGERLVFREETHFVESPPDASALGDDPQCQIGMARIEVPEVNSAVRSRFGSAYGSLDEASLSG
jgi:hypothetical protein